MNKTWLVPDVNDQSNLVKIRANFKPHPEAIEVPAHIANESEKWLKVVSTTDEFGNEIKRVVVDGDLMDAEMDKDFVRKGIKEADDLLQAFRDKRDDLRTQARAFIKYIEGDATMINDMSKSIRFLEFSEYKRSVNMDGNTYFAIVRSAPGEFEIQEFPINQRPSNLLAVAPAGFQPGDEEFLTERQGGGFDIDWDGRLAKFEALEKSAEEARKADKWNTESPIERIKNAFISGD